MSLPPNEPPNVPAADDASHPIDLSEANLGTILTSIGDAVLVTDVNGKVTLLNPVAEALIGWTTAQALGQDSTQVFDIVNEATRQIVPSPVERVLRDGVTVGLANHTILRRRDGTEVHIDDSAAPVRDEQGQLLGVVLVFRDVSEKRAAEEALHATEERLRLATDGANIGTWDLDPQTGILFWDERCRAAFGYPLDLPIDYDICLSLIHPDDREQTDAAVQAALSPQGTGEYGVEFRTIGYSDGLERWARVEGRALFNETHTETLRFVGTIQDITQRRHDEIALSDTRTRLESALSAGNIATWTFDIVGNKVVADDNLAHLFAVDPADAAGGKLEVYLNAIHPDDRERVTATIARAIAEQDTYEAEYRVVAADGQVRWLDTRGRVERDGEGKAIALPGVVLDVTARRETADALVRSEARFRVQADAMPQMVWATDPDGNHLYYNRRWYDYTGQTIEESMGFGFALALHPDDYDRTIERWRQAWEGGADYEIEYRFRRWDGTYRWFVGRAEPVRDPETGQIVLWAGTCTDIDELKRMQAELAEASRKNQRIAETLQRSMLLAPPEDTFDGISVGTHYEAAWDEAQIGGDFFDALPLDDGNVALIVGDSTGKGLEAARYISELEFVLRAYLRESADPALALQRLNNYLVNGQRLDKRAENALAAVIVAVVNGATGRVQIAAGGAEPPLVIRVKAGSAEEIPAAGVVLGAQAGTTYDAISLALDPGDVLLLTTDGITEARNRKTRQFFGYDGLIRSVEDALGADATSLEALASDIVTRAKAFAGGVLTDDVCLLVARRT